MTTWHDREPLSEATHFALLSAEPDAEYRLGCDAVVLASVGVEDWGREMVQTAAQYVRPAI
jgi:hypothetical protein